MTELFVTHATVFELNATVVDVISLPGIDNAIVLKHIGLAEVHFVRIREHSKCVGPTLTLTPLLSVSCIV
jgi:hypothetical protein